MSIDIYPAFIQGREIIHADDWNEDSTINIANGNFYHLVETMGISRMAVAPGTMSVKAMKMALDTSPPTRYTERLRKLCAIADIKRANVIAFS